MEIDNKLLSDCKLIRELDNSSLLLMDNALVNWFILVPKCSERELTALPLDTQIEILKEINLVAAFIETAYTPDKLNIAAIGNIVSQLHIHVIGRRHDDAYWPDPVWGKPQREAYSDEEVAAIKARFESYLSA